MHRIRLILSNQDDPQLVETQFESGEGKRRSIKKAARGLYEGGPGSDYGCFTWSKGVRALTVFLLRWAAWGRRPAAEQDAPPPNVEGRRGTLAAILNDALTKKPQWLSDVFGCSIDGCPRTEFIKRLNPDFKTNPNGPVRIFLDCSQLPPERIDVAINGELVQTSAVLSNIAGRLVSRYFKHNSEVLSTSGEGTPEKAPPSATERRTMSPPLAMNAPRPPALLVGRKADLRKLVDLLRISTERRARGMCVVRGWPGVGKSSIVAALAHSRDISHLFPDGVLWMSLGQKPNLHLELSIWARHLRISSAIHAATLREAASRLRETLVDKCMLLIVDDVWEVAHAESLDVGGSRCAMLVTTRIPSIAEALSHEQEKVYVLRVLDEAHSLELLFALAPMTREYPVPARQLVKKIEGLPLALKVAGLLLRMEMKMGWGLGDLLRELHNETMLLNTSAPADCADLVSQTTPTVAALLRKSTDHLDAKLRQYFALLGPFAPKPATFDIRALAAMWKVADPKPVVRLLVNRGLLEPAEDGRFQMHALMVTHARSLLAD